MEIGFWQYLTKELTELDALPLKQRIPEVALFRGCSLQAGFFSNQRGLLQKRDGKEFTKQFLLDRLLALSAKTAEATDLCAQTPVAILRRNAAGVAGPPKAHVLNASQLMELLERTERGLLEDCRKLPHMEDEEWSLQSLIVPPTNLRVVSVYSRENGEESFDLVGQSFSQVYPLDGQEPSTGTSSSSHSMRSVFIPDAFASQVEAKSKHLVAYVQRFHGRGLGSLISEFIPDDSGKAVLHGFWKVEMLEGKTMIYTASGLDSPMPSTAVPSITESNHTSRPTSASQSAVQSRPVSATSKEAEWVSSPSAAEARPSSQGFGGSVAANAARRAMSISEDLHIQEDYSEDNELEEAIERIRASEPYTRRAARCGRTAAPQESAPRMAASEFVDPPRAQYDGSSGVKQPAQPASQSTSPLDDAQARTAALSSRMRPRSAEQRSYAASQSSRPSSARSVRSRANWSVQSTPARSVVGNIRCDQLISRHLPEREARSKMISVLARQLERLRDHIPAFAQQWQTVEAFVNVCQQRVVDKAKEVEALEEEIRMLQKLHARQYDLLDRGLQRQVEEAKAAWKARRRHVEACKQEEYEVHSKVVAQEQRTKALKTTLDKTWRQMEDMQQSVSRSRVVLEARANGDWSADFDESTMCSKSRQMAEEIARHMEVRQELNSQRNQLHAAAEVLGQQRVYSSRIEEFVRKISGGGGRYVLPLPLKREAQRLMKSASTQQREVSVLLQEAL